MTALAHGAAVNPFATRFHAPGRVAFFFEAEQGAASADELLNAFLAAGARGEIVGPHGTGKTTLLRALEAAAAARGLRTETVTLRDGGERFRLPAADLLRERHPGRAPASCPATPLPPVLILDGAEQLARPAWYALRLRCRIRRLGLLATSHRALGLPVLYRTRADEALAQRVAAAVLAQSPHAARLTTPADVAAALAQTRGDLREALFKLYDLYEARWRA
ncbi:MAG: hypothetical protein KIS92_07665 [Planctomycetota bacterium]|nr:hypothetical protein [Planctomycetota bacterium]